MAGGSHEPLEVVLFGMPYLRHRGADRETVLTDAVASVLAYLVLNGERLHSRSVLAGRFWGDRCEEAARRCLNTTLWRLRRLLEPHGVTRGSYLRAPSRYAVSFNWDGPCWVDAVEFQQATAWLATTAPDAPAPGRVERLEQALDRQARGRLLEGVDGEWVAQERQRFEILYVEGLRWLLRHYVAIDAHHRALACGRQILAVDPLREQVHCDLMRVYARLGERAMVVRQFNWCVEVTRQELGIGPLAKTRALYHTLLNDEHVQHRI